MIVFTETYGRRDLMSVSLAFSRNLSLSTRDAGRLYGNFKSPRKVLIGF